jgi:aspartyl/asparaginyl beta-hydroxylase (cupin superfamily)
LEQISEAFQAQLLDRLHAGGYRRDASSARFNHGLDMLMGKAEREDDARPFPQKPHAFYLPGMPYQPFYPSEELAWVKEVEAATDRIEAELNACLASRAQAFTPYVHGGLEMPGQTPDTLKDHDNWTAAFLISDGVEDTEWSASCPTVSALMGTLPLAAIRGFSPSVLFSKLKPGARIDPHTGLLNCRLICHLPLVVPAGCGLRVGEERRDVVRGEVWAFDDSINHEAWNDSADDRIVLIFDVWHPDLTEQERRDITSLLEAVSA